MIFKTLDKKFIVKQDFSSFAALLILKIIERFFGNITYLIAEL